MTLREDLADFNAGVARARMATVARWVALAKEDSDG